MWSLAHFLNAQSSLIFPYHQSPRWAALMCAAGIFIYQTLDAIDGKQARRTNSSSPLGELFDHGCDSLSTGNCKNLTFYCKIIKLFLGR
jgi:phosphatidylglycerophosphate synthase